jgi:hypothetical protein
VILAANFLSQEVRRFGNVLAYGFGSPIRLLQNVEARSKKHPQSSIHVFPFRYRQEDYYADLNVAIRYIPHFLVNLSLNRANLLSCDQTLWRRCSTLLPAHKATTHNARIRKVVISSFPPSRRSKLRGSFSLDEFSIELTDAVAPVLVFPEFCL